MCAIFASRGPMKEGFEAMEEFFHMGGYAAYVWTSYGLAAAVILALVWQSLSDWRRQSSLAAELEKAAGGRVRRAAAPAREDDR